MLSNLSDDHGDSCCWVVLAQGPGGLCHWPEECLQILTNHKEYWPTMLLIISTTSANNHPINYALQCCSDSEDKKNHPPWDQSYHATIPVEKKCTDNNNSEQVMPMLAHKINEMVMVTKKQEARKSWTSAGGWPCKANISDSVWTVLTKNNAAGVMLIS